MSEDPPAPPLLYESGSPISCFDLNLILELDHNVAANRSFSPGFQPSRDSFCVLVSLPPTLKTAVPREQSTITSTCLDRMSTDFPSTDPPVWLEAKPTLPCRWSRSSCALTFGESFKTPNSIASLPETSLMHHTATPELNASDTIVIGPLRFIFRERPSPDSDMPLSLQWPASGLAYTTLDDSSALKSTAAL